MVRQAVRTAPPLPSAEPLTNPALGALRTVFNDLAATVHALGELMLDVAPAYLSDTDAADVLAPLCEAIGKDLEAGLVARHYAFSGDRRTLHGTIL
ncbi:hypothetical protein [Streptomyces cinereoruber]|uniref:hypothetical protein n=1 Tax=Streptomyces cinereoruber TaxID=67260 RepID=UPI00362A5264